MPKIKVPANAVPRIDHATVAEALGAEPLLPCPFCGHVGIGGAVAKLHPVHGGKVPSADQAYAYCSKCGATGPTSDNAFRAWQTRPEGLNTR